MYDIHSPRVCETEQEMTEQLTCAGQVFPAAQLSVNPDCGLKTRGWPEVEAALLNMVNAAQQVRRQVAP